MKTTAKMGLMIIALLGTSFLGYSQKKQIEFTVTRVINTSADNVWAVVGEDFGAIAKSHPKIVSSSYLNGTLKGGEGAERQCNFNDKGTKYVKEKQTRYDPSNYTFHVDIYHAGGLPLDPEYNSAVYRVEAIDENSCRLSMDMKLRTKPAFMGAMAKGKFKKTLADYLIAVEHHAITKEDVTKDNFKEIKKKYKS